MLLLGLATAAGAAPTTGKAKIRSINVPPGYELQLTYIDQSGSQKTRAFQSGETVRIDDLKQVVKLKVVKVEVIATSTITKDSAPPSVIEFVIKGEKLDTSFIAKSDTGVETSIQIVTATDTADSILKLMPDTTLIVDTTLTIDTTLIVDTTLIIDTTLIVDTTLTIDTTLIVDTTLIIDTTVIADTMIIDTTALVDTSIIDTSLASLTDTSWLNPLTISLIPEKSGDDSGRVPVTDVVVYIGDRVRIRAEGAGGEFVYSLTSNNSGATIDLDGIYTAGSQGGTNDVIRVSARNGEPVEGTVSVIRTDTTNSNSVPSFGQIQWVNAEGKLQASNFALSSQTGEIKLPDLTGKKVTDIILPEGYEVFVEVAE